MSLRESGAHDISKYFQTTILKEQEALHIDCHSRPDRVFSAGIFNRVKINKHCPSKYPMHADNTAT